MLRVIVCAGRGFDGQATVQRALLKLKKLDPHAVLVTGSYEAEVMTAKLWSLMGGFVEEHLPQWKIHGKDAGRIRNDDVLKRSGDLCISLQHGVEEPWMARECRTKGMTVWTFNDDYNVIDIEVVDVSTTIA